MKQSRRQHLALLGGTAFSALVPNVVLADGHAQTYEVLMLNRDPENKKETQVFVPPVLRVNVGDTVKFISADPAHNSQVDKKLMPAGGDEWKGRIGKDVDVTFTVEGAYGYQCQPHASAGMVGLVLVGDVSGNYEDIKGGRFRGKAKKRYEAYFAMADEMLAAEA